MIVKRDGSLEPFCAQKLARTLRRALRRGEEDVRLADALARAVKVHLLRRDKVRASGSEYVLRCAHAALRETGLAAAAAALVRQQVRRSRRRAQTQVFNWNRPERGTRAWRKSALVDTLEERYGTTRFAARMVAGLVERQVFALRDRMISTAMIEGLLQIELAAWGLFDDGSDWPQVEAEPLEPPVRRDPPSAQEEFEPS